MSFINKLKVIYTFLKEFNISRKLLFIIVALMTLQALLEAFSAGLIIPFLNSFQNVKSSTQESNTFLELLNSLVSNIDSEHKFAILLLLILLMMGLVQLLGIINNRFILNFSMFRVQNVVSNTLFKKILNVRLKFFYNKRSGDLINNLNMDVNRAFNCIQCMLKIFSDSFFCIGYLIMGFLFVPIHTIFLVMFIFVLSVGLKFLLPFIYELGKKNRKSMENANNIVVESMQGFKNIVLSNAEQQSIKNFSESMYRYYHTIFNSSWITTSIYPAMKFFILFFIALFLMFNMNNIKDSNPEFISITLFFLFISGNIIRYLGNMNNAYASFAFNYEGLNVLLSLNSELEQWCTPSNKNLLKLEKYLTGISVKNLSFEYIDGETILHDLTFNIPKNKKVAFVGKSGSGKSTLIDILSGFHDDFDGEITINGNDLRKTVKSDWRSLLGYVSQESFIFNDTVRNNLTFGFSKDISDTEIEEACRNAQIFDTIMGFSNGFDTILGERGIRLSGGEKQRLAIARLFLKKPEIVFLDEATSALDSESEKLVKESLYNLSKGRTVIAVAHRLSTISDFDIINVLENGRIIESGNHNQLIEKNGYYNNYYSIQKMGEYIE